MRTTLQIDDDVLSIAKQLASQRDMSIGQVVSELARKGLKPTVAYRFTDDFPVFEVHEDTPVFGLDEVKDALEDS